MNDTGLAPIDQKDECYYCAGPRHPFLLDTCSDCFIRRMAMVSTSDRRVLVAFAGLASRVMRRVNEKA